MGTSNKQNINEDYYALPRCPFMQVITTTHKGIVTEECNCCIYFNMGECKIETIIDYHYQQIKSKT